MKDPTNEVRVCGQCSDPTYDEEYSCMADSGCELVLCGACSCPEVHFRDDGSCPPWWGEGLTEEEQSERMQEAAEIYFEHES